MVIVRPSASLARKMNLVLPRGMSHSQSMNRMGDWYLTELNLGSARLILSVSSIGRLGVVLKAAPYNTLPFRLATSVKQALLALGVDDVFCESETHAMSECFFEKSVDRSVLGTINDYRHNLRASFQMGRLDANAPLEMTKTLAKMPMRTLGWKYPVEAVKELFAPSRSEGGLASKVESPPVYTFLNRKGESYFVHEGLTSLKNIKYFVSKNNQGALAAVPRGLEVIENLNGQVVIRKIVKSRIAHSDFEAIQRKVRAIKRLAQYKVEVVRDTVVIYAPDNDDSISALQQRKAMQELSPLADFERLALLLNKDVNDVLKESFKSLGKTLPEIHSWAMQEARERRAHMVEQMLASTRYSAVMRFVLVPEPNVPIYAVERREYRSGRDAWLRLEEGELLSLIKYIRHIGQESFFELI